MAGTQGDTGGKGQEGYGWKREGVDGKRQGREKEWVKERRKEGNRGGREGKGMKGYGWREEM